MGYYSYVSFTTSKKDYNKILDAQNKIPKSRLFDEAEITDYKQNGLDCTHVDLGSIKYYKEFEEIKVLEKSLSKAKDGYVFCRLGEEPGDIEFRNRTKHPEFMKEFEFIRELQQNLNKELKDAVSNERNSELEGGEEFDG